MGFKLTSLNLSLGRISGIKITLHWSFVVIIPWIGLMALLQGWSLLSFLLPALVIVVVFVCVLLHELGHAFAARYYKINTHGITLMPLGGVALLESQPEEPLQEFVVAIAGPMVNLAIMAVLLPFILYAQADPFSLLREGLEVNPAALVFQLNAALFLFNMIPAFPMDGGRILRSLLSLKISRFKATRIAAILGMTFAGAMALYGFMESMWYAFIGVFVGLNAYNELRNNKTLEHLAQYQAADLADTSFVLYDGPYDQAALVEYIEHVPVRYVVVQAPAQEEDSVIPEPPADKQSMHPQFLVHCRGDKYTQPASRTTVDDGTEVQAESRPTMAPAIESLPDVQMDKLFRQMNRVGARYALLGTSAHIAGIVDLAEVFRRDANS